MSIKRVRAELHALREEVEAKNGREWIEIRVPEGMPDEAMALWLSDNVEADWQRHFILRIADPACEAPSIVRRWLSGHTRGVMLKLTLNDLAVC